MKGEQLKEVDSTEAAFQNIFDEARYNTMLERKEKRLSYRAMQAALFIMLYQHEPILYLPFQILTLCLDIDEHLVAWRNKHASMVRRMLGVKMGTGGSSGYYHLRSTTQRHRIFDDIADLATFLIPRHALPPLPAGMRSRLNFHAPETNGAGSPTSSSSYATAAAAARGAAQ